LSRTATVGALVAALLVGGCGSARCKNGTLLLTVTLPAAAQAGDALVIDVSGGGLSIRGTATLHAASSGTLELDLPQYPKGATLTVTATLGALFGTTTVTLSDACETASLTLTDQGLGDGGDDAGDLAAMADLTLLPDLTPCPIGTRICGGSCVATSDPLWSSDDYACGAAGLGCSAGSTCQSGGCVAATAANINPSSKGMRNVLVTSGGKIWWTSSMGIDGSCDPTVANGCDATGNLCAGSFGGNIGAIGIVGANMFYVSLVESPGTIRTSANTCPNGSPIAATDPNAINWMASDGTSLFWTDDNGMVMELLNGTGTPGAVVSSGPAHAQQLAVVKAGAVSTLYYAAWGAGTTTGEVRAVVIGGTTFTQLATGQAKPTFLAISGNNIFWTNAGDGSVWMNTLDGSAASARPMATGQSAPMGVVADASAVYWANNGDGTIMKQPLCGGNAIKLAMGQNTPTAIVSISNKLYWLSSGANQIATVAQ
jgi:hypothetical protein